MKQHSSKGTVFHIGQEVCRIFNRGFPTESMTQLNLSPEFVMAPLGLFGYSAPMTPYETNTHKNANQITALNKITFESGP